MLPLGYILRPATNADCAAVRTIVLWVLAEYGLESDLSTTDADLFDLEGHYKSLGGCFDVVVDAEGQIVASVGLQPQGEGICEMRKMYLLPEHRGLGIGRALMEHALARARELGFTEIHLETARVLQQATRLYESVGFTPYEPEHCAARCDIAYRLRL